jgi:hypothetical protein
LLAPQLAQQAPLALVWPGVGARRERRSQCVVFA